MTNREIITEARSLYGFSEPTDNELPFYEIENIMADLFENNYDCMPPCIGKTKEEFNDRSFECWAIKEIYDFVLEYMYPKKTATIEEYEDILSNFIRKMEHYSEARKKLERDSYIFDLASGIAENLLVILEDIE